MFYKLRIPRTANTVRGQHRPRPPNGRDEQEWDISIHRNGTSRFIATKQNKHDERVEARDLITAKRPRKNWTSWSAKLHTGSLDLAAQAEAWAPQHGLVMVETFEAGGQSHGGAHAWEPTMPLQA